MKKTWCSTIIPILALLCLLFGYAALRFYQESNFLRSKIPYLMEREKIKYFQLISVDDLSEVNTLLDVPKPKLILIFERPCNACNKNVNFWRRISKIIGADAEVYGILLDKLENAVSFKDDANLNFKLYVPKDIDRFITENSVHLNSAQSMIYKDGVRYLKHGNLSPDDATGIIRAVRGLCSEGNKQ